MVLGLSSHQYSIFMIETPVKLRTASNIRIWLQTANATEKMVNSPPEQGENKPS